jgi:hypothetical protein
MMGTKKLATGLEAGVTAVKKADDSLRTVMAISAACLVVGLLTLAVVLATRGARA